MADLQFDGERAYQHLHHLAVDIGARLGGSEGEHQAAQYIKQHFAGLGLTAHLEPFPVQGFDLTEKQLTVLDPPLGDVFCEVYYLNQDTPPEGLEADVVYVGPGQLENLGPEIAGRIVMVLGGVRGAYEQLMRFGPAGLIIIEAEPDKAPLRIEMLPELRSKFGAVPTVRISHEDGLRLVKAGVKRARILVRTVETEATSHNVIGELRGTVFPDEIVVVGGHYDTSLGIQGASDNAGGTVLVMELARVFAARGSKRTLRFAAWGSEEMGLRGSVHHIKTLKKADKAARKAEGFVKERDKTELDQHVLCVNLDVHGAILGENHSRTLGPGDLSAAVRLMAKEHGPAYEVAEDIYSSDGMPFSEAGVPSISFARSGGTTRYLHTPADIIDYLGPQALAESGRFVEEFLVRYVTEARAFPFEREVPDNLKNKIRDYFQKRLRIDYYEDDEDEKGAS
ncbi:MAG: M20/M25/M40 family metallo-hydrolase [Chloroflexi bacterium]|nr:M20/M25/M40 family metallo-hydrolase [Chloroflexota bacterium]MBU1750161.1 M20/M25/M40 family metallo-hydrolase [Chloroflexota bacterium]